MSGGKTDYVICVPDTANHQIMRAANMLQSWLEKIGGARLEIKAGNSDLPAEAIVFNSDARAGFEDAFSIVSIDRRL